MYINSLTGNEYYLYRKKNLKLNPWERNHLNLDFYNFEKKLINKFNKWYNIFYKTKDNSLLPEINCFVLPCILNNPKLNINLEKFDPKILSVINNCLQGGKLLLFPKEKTPRDYSLIRLIKSKKKFVEYKNLTYGEYVIIVEDYEYLSIDKLYVDINLQKNRIEKMMKKTIIDDDHLINSFCATIHGSPFIVNDKGGISLASVLNDSTFSQELMKTLQMIIPPGMRAALPPKKFLIGKKEFCFKGVTTNVAEKYFNPGHCFSTIIGGNYEPIDDELMRRKKFLGEYSIFGSLIFRGEGEELFQDVLKKFTDTEIVLPDQEKLKYADVDLTKARKEIDESLWSQIAYLKQINPSFDLSTKKIYLKLKKDWEFILSEMNYEESLEIQSSFKAKATLSNIIRLARSIARKTEEEKVSEDHIDKARGLFLDNANSMINNPFFDNIKKEIKHKKEDKKFIVLQSLLSHNKMNLHEIYNKVGKYFKNKRELEDLLIKLNENGTIIKNQKQEYMWT